MTTRLNIFHGDCLEILDKIPTDSVDMVLADPPYGTTRSKWDTVIDLDKLWVQLHRVCKDKGAILLFGSEPFSSTLRLSNIHNYKYDWIWKKQKASNFQLTNFQVGKVHEIISVFSKYSSTYTKNVKNMNYFPKRIGDKISKRTLCIYNNDDNNTIFSSAFKLNDDVNKKVVTYVGKLPTSILEYNVDISNKFHPTQKPTELLKMLIDTYTVENDVVLDFCMGGGSTGIASLSTNRKFIGIEKDSKYFNISKERLNNLY